MDKEMREDGVGEPGTEAPSNGGNDYVKALLRYLPAFKAEWERLYDSDRLLDNDFEAFVQVLEIVSGSTGVLSSGEAQQAEYERMHSLAHAWAQACYFKGLGRPARVDETRGAFQKALRALIAHGVAMPSEGTTK